MAALQKTGMFKYFLQLAELLLLYVVLQYETLVPTLVPKPKIINKNKQDFQFICQKGNKQLFAS